MPTQDNPTDFLALLQNSTKKLNSEKFYDALDSESSYLTKYVQICNELPVRIKNDEVNIICTKFLRYLKNCEALNNGSYKYDVSRLLNYWLYDELTKIYGTDDELDINLGFSKFQYVWKYQNFFPSNEPNYQKCKPDSKTVNHHDWKNRKELYDYCINYEFIAPTCQYYVEECKEHCEYIKGKSQLYEHFESLCNPKGIDCPEFYDKCKSYNPNIVLKALNCHEKLKTERDPNLEVGALQHSPGQGLESATDVPGPGLSKHADAPDSVLTQENSDIGTKVGHSVLGVAPVLLTATALYRYTPVGSWIRKLGGYNQSGISDMDGFSSYTQESGDMFSDSGENYISYQPI
ncbi:PIR protein [Plasmodium ovale]|uniref:PIR Superfamily Protein n=2 Tax=Plasmodium ovale TaxID=36330 RepID=A0A1A8WF90_PLAOA|nr:PIR Superfamily Protein [Plasmodium ovale curtisi]SBT02740.1 PIR Superfamily Protein [Plasmodium ovale curtisi]SBT84192.1 PIR protein [Plasmodium ovale]